MSVCLLVDPILLCHDCITSTIRHENIAEYNAPLQEGMVGAKCLKCYSTCVKNGIFMELDDDNLHKH